MKVIIETIPHSEQRLHSTGEPYDSVGNWWWEDQGRTLHMQISGLGDWRKEMCVAVHELVEALEATHLGITDKQVDEFDGNWKPHGNYEEPGDDPKCPVYWPHQHAMVAEQHLANCLGLIWADYAKEVDGLSNYGGGTTSNTEA